MLRQVVLTGVASLVEDTIIIGASLQSEETLAEVVTEDRTADLRTGCYIRRAWGKGQPGNGQSSCASFMSKVGIIDYFSLWNVGSIQSYICKEKLISFAYLNHSMILICIKFSSLLFNCFASFFQHNAWIEITKIQKMEGF